MFEEMKDKNAATADFLRIVEAQQVDAQAIVSQIEEFQRAFRRVYERERNELLSYRHGMWTSFNGKVGNVFELAWDRGWGYADNRNPQDLGECLAAFIVAVEYGVTSRHFDINNVDRILTAVKNMVNKLKEVGLKFKREVIRIERIESKLNRSLTAHQKQLIEKIVAELAG